MSFKNLFRMISFGQTDQGKRSNNEDTFLANQDLSFCLVADGMGGAEAGEIASKIFADTASEFLMKPAKINLFVSKFFKELFIRKKDNNRDSDNELGSKPPIRSENSSEKLIRQIFREANKRIIKHTQKMPSHKGMGCTVELMLLCKNRAVFGHVGDSRVYRLRNKELKQITRDHSYVQEQIDKGLITPEQAITHPKKNVILRAVGVEKKLDLEIIYSDIADNDLFMLCSDGITDVIEENTIRQILLGNSSLGKKVQKLIKTAKKNNSQDNMTVVLSKIVSK